MCGRFGNKIFLAANEIVIEEQKKETCLDGEQKLRLKEKDRFFPFFFFWSLLLSDIERRTSLSQQFRFTSLGSL